jgi:hypothetical protein
MQRRMVRTIIAAGAVLAGGAPHGIAQDPKPAAGKSAPLAWEAKGTLFEACSCSVPCPCNFGQSPSRGFCHTVYAYRLTTARFGTVKLDGLVFGGGEADKKPMAFLDSRATAEQKIALQKLAGAVFGKGGPSSGERSYTWATITTDRSESKFSVRFGEIGGFAADVLIGRDGKSPIVVENNTIWPVHRFVKGKTSSFDYEDSQGNKMHYDGVNANIGDFDLKP